jgi:hypothetical protein
VDGEGRGSDPLAHARGILVAEVAISAPGQAFCGSSPVR